MPDDTPEAPEILEDADVELAWAPAEHETDVSKMPEDKVDEEPEEVPEDE